MGVAKKLGRWTVVAMLGAVVAGTIVYMQRKQPIADSDLWVEISKPIENRPSSSGLFEAPRKVSPDFVPLSELPDIPQQPTDQQIAGSRIFPTQLFPIDSNGRNLEKDNATVSEILRKFRTMEQRDAYNELEKWLSDHPDSRWHSSLKFELSNYRYTRGYFNVARNSWNELWDGLKDNNDLNSLHLGNEVLGKLLDTTLGFARADRLRELVADAEGRVLNGSVEGKLLRATEAVWLLEHVGAQNVMCGVLALNSIGDFKGLEYIRPRLNSVTAEYIATGLSLSEVQRYAAEDYGMDLIAVQREDKNVSIPTPAVMHLADEHFVAILAENMDANEYFIQDHTLDFNGWVDRAALLELSSGYFLVESGDIPFGWKKVVNNDARNIYGRDGAHGMSPPSDTVGPNSPTAGGGGGGGPGGGPPGGPPPAPPPGPPPPCDGGGGGSSAGFGMPSYTFLPMPGAVRITDIPVTYPVPVGPQVLLKLNYNDLDSSAPASPPTFSNVGLTWSTDWVAWVDHISGTPVNGAQLSVHVSGGGLERSTYDSSKEYFGPNQFSFSTIAKTGTYTYVRSFPDGSQEIFNAPDNSSSPNRVFLSEKIDPQGNSITFAYDANSRLVSVTDEIGQVTTLQYDHPADIYKITSVTDPFGRMAHLAYNVGGQLISVTDQIDLTSSFTYHADGFIETMVTPYGTNSFEKLNEVSGSLRTLEVTDAKGFKERIMYQDQSGGHAVSSINPPPSSVVVAGETIPFYAEETYRLQFRNSYYWSKEAMKVAPGDYDVARNYRWFTDNNTRVTSVMEAYKEPLEDRVWYNYPGQTASLGLYIGNTSRPEKTLRVLSDGTPQLVQTYYNEMGNLTKTVDPIGRTTEYSYETNGVDLLEMRQTSNGNNDLLGAITYNSLHLPATVMDTAGQMTYFVYNDRGQVLASTNALNEVATYSYDMNGFLLAVEGALPGTNDTTRFAYDIVGRISSVTEPDGYLVSFEYDGFDRVVKSTYPDGTYVSNAYDRLHLASVTDRLERNTVFEFDALQQLATVTDPGGRTTRYEYCVCGHIRSLIDPMGRRTTWHRDVQGRVKYKEYVDGSRTEYEYDDAINWLKQRKDEKGQVTSYVYNVDNSMAAKLYSNEEVPTPSVHYAYDTDYRRITQMVDGIGTNLTTYHIVGALGANQIATIDGAWENDVVAYNYDVLGRRITRSIDGVSQDFEFDAGGRLVGVTNELGAFTFSYDGVMNRLLSQTHESGLKTEYTYYPNEQDRQVSSIVNLMPNGTTPISVFSYTYDSLGRIQTWRQQKGIDNLHAKTWTMGYDDADQLTGVTITRDAVVDITSYAWTYDDAGNRLTHTLDTPFTNYTDRFYYNALNQLTDSTLDLPETTYEWDAEQRLVAINSSTNRSYFSYDGNSLRRRIVEKENGSVIDEKTYLWCGTDLCEERDTSGSSALQKFYRTGFRNLNIGANSYFMRDHLGSIREVVDESGVLLERLDYDPWGKSSLVAGTLVTSFDYTGHFMHIRSGFKLAPFRAYDSVVGRWISRDPLMENGDSPNMYAYVLNDPISLVDPLGLRCTYVQCTGRMVCVNASGEAYYDQTGYSGTGAGRNNPGMQGVPNVGPIPAGSWTVGRTYNSGNTGPNTMTLAPQPGNSCENTPRACNTFRAHGNNRANDASEGCIILPPNRTEIPEGETIDVVPCNN